MCESEKDDGMVLEIRGNLLFDGGFVISYVDIISYKNVVCELCLLVDVLEYCIVECICDLDEVCCEVEQVNCYKICFVVLVVYDLLQLFNVVCMFVLVLCGKLGDLVQQQIVDYIDVVLVVQDVIFNSLLDILWLELGMLQLCVCVFVILLLLEILVCEFGIVVQGRGL